MSRQSYHTSLKELVYHGILPQKYLKKIPTSNVHRWKNDDFDRYVGSEINQIADKHFDTIQILNHYPKMFHAYGKLVQKMVNIASKTQDYRKVMREMVAD